MKLLCFLLTIFCVQCSPQITIQVNETEVGNVLQGMNDLTLLGQIMQGAKKANISQSCKTALCELGEGIEDLSPWAIQFLDATGKIPAGVGLGTFTFLGSYDECLSIDVPVGPNSTLSDRIRGKYAPVTVSTTKLITTIIKSKVNLTIDPAVLSFRWDSCIPSQCSEDDVERSLKRSPIYLLKFSMGRFEIKPVKTILTTSQIVAIFLYSFLGLFLFLGTSLDVFTRLKAHFMQSDSSTPNKTTTLQGIMLSFSMYTNGLKLLNTDMAADSLSSVNGVRFLSMSWVILGHVYYFINRQIVGNMLDAKDLGADFAFQAILNATVSVDSFFFLSGLLVAYVAIKGLRQKGKINWLMYYFHRIWRLTPAYAFIILFGFLWPLFGTGPTWFASTNTWFANCQKYWWASLLYISNVAVKPTEMCVGHGWYLANDMQFYFISPFILFTIYKLPKIGLTFNLAILLSSFIAIGYIETKYSLPPTTLFLASSNDALLKSDEWFRRVYITPWCRIGPYCVGIFAGHFLATKRSLNFSTSTHALLWCIAISFNVSVLYGPYRWNQGYSDPQWVYSIYAATNRTVFAIGLAWVVIACSTGHGGIVNSILSWSPFVALGRMTYMAYLIHPAIQVSLSGILRERLIFRQYIWVIFFLGFLFMSYMVAFILSLSVEAPFLALEKIIFKRGAQKKTDNEPGKPEVPELVAREPDMNVDLTVIKSNGEDNQGFTESEKL